MTVKGPPGKKGPASKRNPCPPGSKKSDGTKPHVTKPKKQKPKVEAHMKKEDYENFKRKKKWIDDRLKARKEGRVISEPKKPDKPKAKPKAPEKPRNKRTGEDYLDRMPKAKPKQNWDDLRSRIRANEEKKRKARRTLPGRI